MSAAAKSGHPTSAMSAADLLAVLVDGYLRYDFAEPKSPANDRLVFSKGHASTLLYAIYRAAGVVSDEEILDYRKLGSMLEGHPTPRHPVGRRRHRLARPGPARSASGWRSPAKYLDRLPNRVWVLCGDSEMAEGSMWEAFEHAAHYELDNLTAIIDVNRLGQRGETMVGWDLDVYVERARGVRLARDRDRRPRRRGDRRARSPRRSRRPGKPTVVVARTLKGKGVAAVENQNGFHGKPLDDPDAAIAELGGLRDIRIEVAKPEPGEPHRFADERRSSSRATSSAPRSRRARRTATRSRRSAPRGRTSSPSTARSRTRRSPRSSRRRIPSGTSRCTSPSSRWSPRRSGSRRVGWRPFASTFAAFLSRAYDFVRMAAISRATLRRSRGSHAGVSIGEDGPSQMALEDIAVVPRDPRQRPCSTRATRTRRRSSSPRWPTPTGSRTCARCGRRRRSSTARTRSSRSAAAACFARRTTTRSRSSAPGSPCTRR